MSEQNEKSNRVARILTVAVSLIFGFFVVSLLNTYFGPTSDFHIRRHPEEYETLDYASVAIRPEWYEGKKMHVDGVFLGFIKSAPNSESDMVYLRIGERENQNRVWIACAILPESDVEKLTPGMDVSIFGKCLGTLTTQTLFEDHEFPGVLIYVFDYGYQF